jgi:hypothetical protein
MIDSSKSQLLLMATLLETNEWCDMRKMAKHQKNHFIWNANNTDPDETNSNQEWYTTGTDGDHRQWQRDFHEKTKTPDKPQRKPNDWLKVSINYHMKLENWTLKIQKNIEKSRKKNPEQHKPQKKGPRGIRIMKKGYEWGISDVPGDQEWWKGVIW